MGAVGDIIGNYWWLVFVVGGPVAGGVKAVAAANERRAQRRLERYRIKQQAKIATAQAQGVVRVDRERDLRAITKLLAEHDDIDTRWFAYETDVINLLEFPMITDMREPLTAAFHRAKRTADSLRPDTADDLVGLADAQETYRVAVHDYAVAFDTAESEARRRRRGDFSEPEQRRLVRAQGLLRMAMDIGSTPAERQAAYRRAREELDGLVSLPTVTYAQLERSVSGELEA
ncbi:hypothetical protein ACQ7HM_15555 [Williamsia sp. MIQD14]|uniref:hypothetical protein n=1 Tax=Williamsia sp. MIQD14 TaxID=3425703 RepID=UPI003DA0ED8D